MKNIFKLIVLLALNNVLKAQNNNQINVSRPNVNILYVGLNNNITIESDGFTLGAVTGTVIYIAIKAS